MSSQIQEVRKELQRSKNRTQSLRGELAVRKQQASDSEVEAKVWSVRSDILTEQRDGLLTTIESLNQQVVSTSWLLN